MTMPFTAYQLYDRVGQSECPARSLFDAALPSMPPCDDLFAEP